MKKYFKYLLFAALVILVAATLLLKTSAVLLDIRITPTNEEFRTLARINGTDGPPASGIDESQASRIACKGAGDILCTYQGGWKMCFENKGDYNTKEEVCARFTVTVDGQSAPPVSAEFSSLLEERSICSNMEMASYNPPSTKSTCASPFVGSYIACAGENDKICKLSTGANTYYGCTQFDNCKDIMGSSQAQEITNVVWVKYDGLSGGPKYDGKCRKTFVTETDGDNEGIIRKTYTTKQECEAAVTLLSRTPLPTPSLEVMPTCKSTEYIRMSDMSCQPNSNCWDTSHADYNRMECRGIRRTMPSPSPSPSPVPSPITKPKCARKPDSAKGSVEPTGLPEGQEAQEISPYSLWLCYSQPDTTTSCTPQAAKRLGNTTSPCVYGQESIVCPEKDSIAYRDGNNIKCTLVKKVEVRTETIITPPPPPTIITETIRETIEVRSPISVVLPTVVTEDNCKEYKTAIDEQVIDQGNALITAADELIKTTGVKNPEFKKVFYATLKESAKNSRKLEKFVKGAECDKEKLNEIQTAAKNFKTEQEKINQGIVFIDKDIKVQNRWVGIDKDSKWLEKFAKSVKGDPRKEKIYAEDLKAFEEAKTDFDELLKADKEEKVFGFEIADVQEKMEKIRKNIEKNPSIKTEAKNATLKKAGTGSKKSLKQSSKAKKTSKKSSKKKKNTKKKSQ